MVESTTTPAIQHLANVTISGNTSVSNGGGISNVNSSPTLTNVIISGNSATFSGGGMLNQSSSPTLTNVIISGNSAFSGGGMANHQQRPDLDQCDHQRQPG